MKIPDWFSFLLLSAAAWRVFRLISEDDILNRPRAWLLGYSGWKEGEKLPDSYRVKWGEWVTCPYCAGFWVSLLWWGAYQLWPHGTVVSAVPLALNAVLIGIYLIFEKLAED